MRNVPRYPSVPTAPVTVFDANHGLVPRTGTSRRDRFLGSSKDDVFNAGAGDDLLFGHSGHDQLYGGHGDDVVDGGAGHDSLYGGDGSDTLRGGSGDDFLAAGRGRNSVFGGEGNDHILIEGNGAYYGETGHDAFYLKSNAATLYGGKGKDTLYLDDIPLLSGFPGLRDGAEIDLTRNQIGATGGDALFMVFEIEEIYGTKGSDFFRGNSENNYFVGGKGDDEFISSDGDDTFVGGDGNDVYQFNREHLRNNSIVRYSLGHDQIVLDNVQASELQSIRYQGAHLILNFQFEDQSRHFILTIENGAAAYRDGQLGIAISKPVKQQADIVERWQAVSANNYLAGQASMIGGKGSDVLKVMNGGGSSAFRTQMTGGAGADHFILNFNQSLVNVTDFRSSEGDVVTFTRSSGISSFKEMFANARNANNGSVIVDAKIDGFTVNYVFNGLTKANLETAYLSRAIHFAP